MLRSGDLLFFALGSGEYSELASAYRRTAAVLPPLPPPSYFPPPPLLAAERPRSGAAKHSVDRAWH